jgi:hypothetical protein
MELDELKSGWNILNKKADEMEEQNKLLARKALNKRIKNTRARIVSIDTLKMGIITALLFLMNNYFNQKYPSAMGDWTVRSIGILTMGMVFITVFNTRLLSRIDMNRYSPKEVLENLCRFKIAIYWTNVFIAVLCTIFVILALIYFYNINLMLFYCFASGFVIGLIFVALFLRKRIKKDLRDLNDEIEELKKL